MHQLVPKTQFCDAKEAEVCDNHFSVLQKYVFRLQVLVNDATRVQVAHTLRTTNIVFDTYKFRELKNKLRQIILLSAQSEKTNAKKSDGSIRHGVPQTGNTTQHFRSISVITLT